MAPTPLLSLADVSIDYGPIRAVIDVSFDVFPGELVLIAGANGAGKSSLLRAVSGLVTPSSGRILFDGTPIIGLPPHRIARLGIRHVPEGRRLWPGLTVREHLEIGWRHVPAARRATLESQIVALFPRLAERWRQLAGRMSGGEQQMLAIARGLAGDPRLFLIDELSLGLAPVVVSQLLEAIAAINRAGVTLVVVEQALRQVLPVVHRGFVMQTGRLVLQGTGDELAKNEALGKAYLTV